MNNIQETLKDFQRATDDLKKNGLSEKYFKREAEILKKSKEESEDMKMSEETFKRKFTL